jgi:5-methylcytosine-specific restriction endonuclease McrA
LAYDKADGASMKAARNAKRRALKMQAILPTTDNELIKNLYKQKETLSKKHGERYHVDHIIPLSIGGAHHQDNLRIITAIENMEKGDKYIPELGGVWADNKLARENRKKYEAL